MNKDLDARLIPNGEYREALNVSISKSEGADVGALENIRGNELNIDLGSLNADINALPNAKIIGKYVDYSRDRVFLFLTNFEDGSENQLDNYNLTTTFSPITNCYIFMVDYSEGNIVGTVLVKGNFLNFSKNSPINQINVIEDVLFWTDNRNQPRKINIDLALANPADSANPYYTTEDHISVLKYYPFNAIRLHTDPSNPSQTDTTMKSKSQKWLPTTNAPLVTFPAQSSTAAIPRQHYGDPENPTTPIDGHVFPVMVYWEGLEATGDPFPWTFPTAGRPKDGVVRGFLPDDGTNVWTIAQGDTRISSTSYNIADNQLVQCFDKVFNRTLREDNDCRLIKANVMDEIVIGFDPAPVNAGLWVFDIWAPDVGGLVNPDLIALQFLITNNNAPQTFKPRLFFRYPNPNYDSKYDGDENYLKDKFIRLSYRFKYDDNEYSLAAPFTQPIFMPQQYGQLLPNDDKKIKKSLDVSFMQNLIDYAELFIDLPCPFNELSEKFKVKEIEILFKRSDEVAIKVVDTVEVNNGIASTDTFATYEYKSIKPIKTLPESETIRISDKAPVRALTQEAVGNRIIYGNFIDKRVAPPALLYNARYGKRNLTSAYSPTDYPTYTDREYLLHNCKQNRTYQIGIVLADRFGRQSDVIASYADTLTGTDQKGSTIYAPYIGDDEWNAVASIGYSLKLNLLARIPNVGDIDFPDYKGLYNAETNPLGWYSYKVVVKQQEQEYYNVYVPGIQTRVPYEKSWKPTDTNPLSTTGDPFFNDSTGVLTDPTTMDLVSFQYKGSDPKYQIELGGDNINKVPKSLINVGPLDKEFAGSDTGLYVRVRPTQWRINEQFFYESDFIKPDKVEQIRQFNTFNIEPSETLDKYYDTATSLFVIGDNYNYDFYNAGNILKKEDSLLIASIAGSNSSSHMTPGMSNDAAEKNARWVKIGVLETEPVESKIDVFWETSTAGLISELNEFLIASGQEVLPDGIYNTGSGSWSSSQYTTIPTSENIEVWSQVGSADWVNNVENITPGGTFQPPFEYQYPFNGSPSFSPGYNSGAPMFAGTTLGLSNIQYNGSLWSQSNEFSIVETAKISSNPGKNLGIFEFNASGNQQWDLHSPGVLDYNIECYYGLTKSLPISGNVDNVRPAFFKYVRNGSSSVSPFIGLYSYNNIGDATGGNFFMENSSANKYTNSPSDVDPEGEIAVIGGKYDTNNKVDVGPSNIPYGIKYDDSLYDMYYTEPSPPPVPPSSGVDWQLFQTKMINGSFRNTNWPSNAMFITDAEYFDGLTWVSTSGLFQAFNDSLNEQWYIRTINFSNWSSIYHDAQHRITFRITDGIDDFQIDRVNVWMGIPTA